LVKGRLRHADGVEKLVKRKIRRRENTVKFALFKWLLRYVSNENCPGKGGIFPVWFQKYCPAFRYKYSLEEHISWFCTYMWSIICNMQYTKSVADA